MTICTKPYKTTANFQAHYTARWFAVTSALTMPRTEGGPDANALRKI